MHCTGVACAVHRQRGPTHHTTLRSGLPALPTGHLLAYYHCLLVGSHAAFGRTVNLSFTCYELPIAPYAVFHNTGSFPMFLVPRAPLSHAFSTGHLLHTLVPLLNDLTGSSSFSYIAQTCLHQSRTAST
jgi:hypothetical protein